jgi:hypothetical protein
MSYLFEVLRFNDVEERTAFVMTLESFLRDLQVSCETHQFTETPNDVNR